MEGGDEPVAGRARPGCIEQLQRCRVERGESFRSGRQFDVAAPASRLDHLAEFTDVLFVTSDRADEPADVSRVSVSEICTECTGDDASVSKLRRRELRCLLQQVQLATERSGHCDVEEILVEHPVEEVHVLPVRRRVVVERHRGADDRVDGRADDLVEALADDAIPPVLVRRAAHFGECDVRQIECVGAMDVVDAGPGHVDHLLILGHLLEPVECVEVFLLRLRHDVHVARGALDTVTHHRADDRPQQIVAGFGAQIEEVGVGPLNRVALEVEQVFS